MKQTIRQNTFETNSSSIHCLVVGKDVQPKDFSDLNLTITPYKRSEVGEWMQFKTIEEKLRYLWTIRCKADEYSGYEDSVDELTSMLKTVFSNCNFLDMDYEVEYLEDFEYLFDNILLYDENFIRRLVSEGSIDFTTRDGDYSNWKYESYIRNLRSYRDGKIDNIDLIWSER